MTLGPTPLGEGWALQGPGAREHPEGATRPPGKAHLPLFVLLNPRVPGECHSVSGLPRLPNYVSAHRRPSRSLLPAEENVRALWSLDF